jgi:hypothetical protein
MALKITSKSYPHIRNTGGQHEKLDAKALAEALGADLDSNGFTAIEPHQFASLVDQISARLASSGGRPALKGAELRQKIPLTADDWSSLERIAEKLSHRGRKVTPGQVASAMLHERLRRVRKAYR